jgi:hypothetical protein
MLRKQKVEHLIDKATVESNYIRATALNLHPTLASQSELLQRRAQPAIQSH